VDFWGKRGEMGFAVVERKLGENRKIRFLGRAEEIATAEPKQGGLLMGKCSGEKVILLGKAGLARQLHITERLEHPAQVGKKEKITRIR
jgi:hypothetical protein